MDVDLEHKVIDSVTELIEFAQKEEAVTEAQWRQAVEDILFNQVLRRHPDFPVHQFFFAMGRALGRLEGKKREKRHVTSLQPRLDVVYEILVGAIEAAKKAGASKHQIAKMLERVALCHSLPDLDDPI
jgi:hypothetical protein